MNKLSIIIPVLNESEGIVSLLEHLYNSFQPKNIKEIIVVDGGSTDETIKKVTNFNTAQQSLQNITPKQHAKSSYVNIPSLFSPEIKMVTSARGRAKQLNVGAASAQGSILYFLHADSFPPKNFDAAIITKVEQGFKAGCFRMKFDSNHIILKISQWFTRFNWKICRGGDQSLFVAKDVFHQLKGFNETYEIYEDCELINRLYDTVGFTVIKGVIITSARKYNVNGVAKLQYHFAVIHIKKWLGASPQVLKNYYKKNIVS